MSKGIEKEISYMVDVFKDILQNTIDIVKRHSTVDPNKYIVDLTDKNCVENELKNRFGKDHSNAMSLINGIKTAKDFRNLAISLISHNIIPKKGVIGVIQKVEIIEKRVVALADSNKEYSMLMHYTLITAMRSSLYCNMFTKHSLHKLFGMMFKIAYTMLNSDINMRHVSGFYERTMIIMCAGMKRPSKFNNLKMTPVTNYNDITYYRISDKIIESKDYLRMYIKEYYDKCDIHDFDLCYLICSDFIWDLIFEFKYTFLKDA